MSFPYRVRHVTGLPDAGNWQTAALKVSGQSIAIWRASKGIIINGIR